MITVLLLVAAVLTSTVAAHQMKVSEGLRRPAPALVAVMLYALAICELALLSTRLPLALVYAVWSGGAVLTSAMVGWLMFGERAGWRSVLGMVTITSGAVVLGLTR